MQTIGVLFFFFIATSAFFVLIFLALFIPYWMFLTVKEWISPTPVPEENNLS